MYYDITVQRADQPTAEHFWTGYESHDYAYGAVASVGRIIRESAGFGPRVTYADPERPVDADGTIRLVREGAPYATIRIAPTGHKRPDVGAWSDPGQCRNNRTPTDPPVPEEALGQYHAVGRYPDDLTAEMVCGLVFPVTHVWRVDATVRSARCLTCLALKRA